VTKLNQILAIEKGEKTKSYKQVTDLHHTAVKADLYEGRVRTYTPANEDGEALPDERQVVQQRADDVLQQLTDALAPLWDITAAKDYTNGQSAYADVVIAGRTLVSKAPVSYLLFLEKQLADVETFITKIPTLDASQKWTFDENQKYYATEKTWQNRTKKVMKNHVKAPATDKHPAQVDVYQEDVVVGKFESIRYSGALSLTKKELLLSRVRELKNAVLFAREQANSVEVTKQDVSKALFSFLLNG
jgi:Tfp pilus assembly protein PilN